MKDNRMKRIYVAGKITGLKPAVYKRKFNRAKKRILTDIFPDGAEVVLPTDLCDESMGWFECMGICTEELKKCDVLYLTKGWEESKGATCEKLIAEAIGLEIIVEQSK